jgi:hypothetical protein
MYVGTLFIIVQIVCLIGCLWAHMPFKKMIMVQLLAPAVVFGCSFMIIAAVLFIFAILQFILGLFGIEIEAYGEPITWTILAIIISTITWLYFSNEREYHLSNRK